MCCIEHSARYFVVSLDCTPFCQYNHIRNAADSHSVKINSFSQSLTHATTLSVYRSNVESWSGALQTNESKRKCIVTDNKLQFATYFFLACSLLVSVSHFYSIHLENAKSAYFAFLSTHPITSNKISIEFSLNSLKHILADFYVHTDFAPLFIFRRSQVVCDCV